MGRGRGRRRIGLGLMYYFPFPQVYQRYNKSVVWLIMQEACARYANVEPIVAFMPEPFGTHHSKMMILLRHDDLAQYVLLFYARTEVQGAD